ncbi:MAG: type II toxin-antitoxin system PemK/MazF family toxin [Candidatus Sericytochromatia bacterium]|nr:type II toxin-antitoxin system PemK/MazF family toxin [Candidatus Tanganyikabacteria bacterium]
MPGRDLAPGDVVMIGFPRHDPRGHEQEGLRPAVVVGIPPLPMRFPLVWVVPLTSQTGQWQEANPGLYPLLPAGSAGLMKDSVALGDNLRAVDRARVGAYIGTLDSVLMRPLREILARILST